MTNLEIKNELGQLIRRERGLTVQILNLIQEGLKQRSYLEFGFSSMFDWLTRGFGYSNAAAYRRIEAARISLAIPEVAEKIEAGKINLSNLCTVQTAIKNEQRATGKKVEVRLQRQIIQNIEGKSQADVQKEIMSCLPSAQLTTHQDRRMRVGANTVRLSININEAVASDLHRAKEVLSHKFPFASDADVIAEALNFFLTQKDPLRRGARGAAPAVASSVSDQFTSVASASEVPLLQSISQRLRRSILRQSEGRCTFQDPITKQRCQSRYQIEIDHIVPRAHGGSNDPSNLRPLCRSHNLMMAEKKLGLKTMSKYRSQRGLSV